MAAQECEAPVHQELLSDLAWVIRHHGSIDFAGSGNGACVVKIPKGPVQLPEGPTYSVPEPMLAAGSSWRACVEILKRKMERTW